MQLFFISVGLLAVLFLVINIYFKLAAHYGIMDIPNNRSSHTHKTIRGAGIIFPVGMVAGLIWAGPDYPFFFLGGLLLVATISFIDDVKNLSGSVRFAVHLLAALLFAIEIWGFHQSWVLGILIIIALAVLVNGFNFMDGINGITGIYSIVALLSFLIVNSLLLEFTDSKLLIGVLLSVLVFGFYNFRKRAACFDGDVGSVSMAFFLLYLLALLILQTKELYYLLFISVYLIDFGFTILHRLWLGEKIWQPHRKHLYQLLVNEGGKRHLVVAGYYGILQFLVNGILILLILNSGSVWMLYFSSAFILLLLAFGYWLLRIRYLKKQIIS